jgi:hypothetical protein
MMETAIELSMVMDLATLMGILELKKYALLKMILPHALRESKF